MPKRFTDTEKWKKHWFSELPKEGKLLWLFIVDNCDFCGVCDFNKNIFSAYLGFPITREKITELLGNKISWIETHKFFIPSFIEFQYPGVLNPSNKVHNAIIKRMSFMKNQSPQGAPYGAYEAPKDKDKEMEMEMEKEDNYGGYPDFVAFWDVYCKGSKKNSFNEYLKIKDSFNLEEILNHLDSYFLAYPEKKFRKDGERYLKGKLWETKIDTKDFVEKEETGYVA